MDPGAQIRALSTSFWRQTVPLKEAKTLSDEHKAVLLVVIGYRRKGGISKTRGGGILRLEASFYLDDLLSQGLIYCDPSREFNFGVRPNRLCLRSVFAPIPTFRR